MTRINTDDWVRLQTAAVILGVTRARVKQLVVAELLPAISIDGIDHVRRSAVEARRAADDAGQIPRKRKAT